MPKATHKVTLSEAPNCCGYFIMNHFFKHRNPYSIHDWTESERKYYGYDQKWIDARNQQEYTETKEAYHKRLTAEIGAFTTSYKSKKCYFIAVLNALEITEGADQVLLDIGFEELIPNMKNPTGTNITMYVYHLLPKTKKKVESVLKKAS